MPFLISVIPILRRLLVHQLLVDFVKVPVREPVAAFVLVWEQEVERRGTRCEQAQRKCICSQLSPLTEEGVSPQFQELSHGKVLHLVVLVGLDEDDAEGGAFEVDAFHHAHFRALHVQREEVED